MNPATKRIHSVANALAAPLKAEGFRRARLVFWRADDAHFELLTVQPRTHGSRGAFTVELGVGFPEVAALKGLDTLWAAGRGIFAAPVRAGRPPVCTLHQRLGWLMHGADQWWSVTGRVDVDALANDVLEGFHRHGLPWVDARRSVAKARALAKRSGDTLLHAVLALAMGDRDEATVLLEDVRRTSPVAAREVLRLAKKNGLALR